MILHELAHVLLGHVENLRKGLAVPETAEIDADAFALIHQQMYSAQGVGTLLMHSALEYADDQIISSDPHGAFLCRAYVADIAVAALNNRIKAVLAWPNSQDKFEELYRERLKPGHRSVTVT